MGRGYDVMGAATSAAGRGGTDPLNWLWTLVFIGVAVVLVLWASSKKKK
ncbi:MAG: hypothetical protein WCG80_19450 [Spirochaetales bacterium]